MKYFWFLTFTMLNCVVAELTDDFILSFLQSKRMSSLVYFMCSRKGFLPFMKIMSSAGVRALIYAPEDAKDLSSIVGVYSHTLGIVLDLQCPGSEELLTQVPTLGLQGGLRNWLLLSANGSDTEWLGNIYLPLDSNVALATNEGGCFYLQDLYRIKEQTPLFMTPPELWLPGEPFPRGPARDDWQRVVIRGGFTMIEQHPWDKMFDMSQRHVNTWSKLNYVLMQHVSQMLNYRMNVTLLESCGYLQANSIWTGMTGWLQSGQGDLAIVGCVVTKLRLDIVQYAGETVPWSPRFIFREPSLSSVSNIYTLPFDTEVWGTYLGVVLALTAILHFTQRLDHYVSAHLASPGHSTLWSESLLKSLGLVCQQGWPDTPDNIPSRIIFLFFFILSVFFFTAYAAIIVSLLQSPSSSINSLEDLVEGHLKVAFHDTVYNRNTRNYVNLSAVPVVRKLFQEEVRHKSGIYMDQVYGLELVRQGEIAFHVDTSAYKIISDMWQEFEKCNLKDLHLYPKFSFAMPIQKGSPYREIVTRKIRWLREVGLVKREWKRWVPERPVCTSNSAVFVSVGIQEFGPALKVMMYGIAFSIVVLVLELSSRWKGWWPLAIHR